MLRRRMSWLAALLGCALPAPGKSALPRPRAERLRAAAAAAVYALVRPLDATEISLAVPVGTEDDLGFGAMIPRTQVQPDKCEKQLTHLCP